MNYKIAVCDDSAADRDYICTLIFRWAEGCGHCIEVKTFCSAESFLFALEDEGQFDILLLDIEMGGMDGVTMAKELRRKDENVQIIFVTGYSDYIAEGYEVAALHYLVKPVGQEKLSDVLNRAADRLGKNDKILNLACGGEVARIPLYKIRYAEVFGNYVTIHAATDVTVKMTLGELERMLDGRFYRVSRSAIVNLTCISRVTRAEVKLSDGSCIPLPRGAYDGVNRAIINME